MKKYLKIIFILLGICALNIPSFVVYGGQFALISQWSIKTEKSLFLADIDGDGIMDIIKWWEKSILLEDMKGRAFWQENFSSPIQVIGTLNVDEKPGDEICVAKTSKDTVSLVFKNYRGECVKTYTFSVESLLVWGKDSTRKWTPSKNYSKEFTDKLITRANFLAKTDTLLTEAKDKSGNWNGAIKIEKLLSKSENNYLADAIVLFCTGYGLNPRGIGGYNSKTNKLIWYFPSASGVLWGEEVLVKEGKLDNDNIGDIVIGSYSPANENIVNDMDDMHTYVIALNSKGKLLWKKEVGEYFCEALPRIIDINSNGIDEVVVATEDKRANKDKKGQENDRLLILSGDKGKEITSEKLTSLITGIETGSFSSGGKIVISDVEGYIRIFDTSLKEVKNYYHPAPITIAGVSDLNNAGSPEIVAVTGDCKLLILDGALNVVGKFEDSRISNSSIVTIIPSESKILLEYYRRGTEEYEYTMLKLMEIKTIDKIPPVISLVTPLRDTVSIRENELIVKGKIYDNAKLDSVIINREVIKEMTEDTFSFEKNIKNLPLGNTSFCISAWDKSGNQSAETLNIKREVYISSKIWAVVVGVSDYSDTTIPKLKYAHKDAQAFFDFLRSRKEAGIFKDFEGKCLLNKEATLENVRSAFGEYSARANLNDYFFIYFACHGLVDEQGFPFLMLSDSKANNMIATALPMNEIDGLLRDRIKSEKTIVLVDACHSGNIGSEVRGTPDIYTDLGKKIEKYNGKVFITSTRERQFAKEDDKLGHGIFTNQLLKGLEGAADADKDNRISLIELYNYLEENVSFDSRNTQQPMLKGLYSGEMILNVLQK